MQLFRSAYPNRKEVDTFQVLNAIAFFIGSLTNFKTPFDQFISGETSAIDPSVLRGYDLFMGKAECGGCHFPPLFSGLEPPFFTKHHFHSHGVSRAIRYPDIVDTDRGLADLSHNEGDAFQFKIPTLRNLPYTGPYMHNGIFNDTKELFTFLLEGTPKSLNQADFPNAPNALNAEEQMALQTFLMSISDIHLTNAFSTPSELPITDGSVAPRARRPGGVY